ncbi:TPA: hypothetical protein SCV06_001522 [Campylobacter jejuni]|nr:hypothetical protein [Campylobacter jejuni]
MNLEFSKETQHFLTNYCKDNNLSEKEVLELALSYLEHKIRIDGYKKDVELYEQGKLKTLDFDETFDDIRKDLE